MLGLGHFISNLLHDVVALIGCAIVYVKFLSRDAWRSARGQALRAWCAANQTLALGIAATAAFALFVLVPMANGMALFHAGHHAFTLLDGVCFVALAVFWRRYHQAVRLQIARRVPTINGTARDVPRLGEKKR